MQPDWISLVAGRGTLALLALLTLSGGNAARAEQTELLVYGSIETDEVVRWTEQFHRDNPQIKLRVVRDSTGVITARILAERDRPQADVIWRLANTSLIEFSRRNLLEPYRPKDHDKIIAQFQDRADPPQWVGHIGYMAAVCVNRSEMERRGLTTPSRWQDLARQDYRGLIVMPNPASSGTGYMLVASWISMFGEEGAWNFMDRLHGNIAQYVHSGSKPCNQAAEGEFPIGISFANRAARLRSSGAQIDIVFPNEGLGWDLEGSAILRGTRKLDAARRFMDWAIGPSAMKLYAENYPLIGRPEFARAVENHPKNGFDLLHAVDLWASSAQRQRILDQWRRRYDQNSEPR